MKKRALETTGDGDDNPRPAGVHWAGDTEMLRKQAMKYLVFLTRSGARLPKFPEDLLKMMKRDGVLLLPEHWSASTTIKVFAGFDAFVDDVMKAHTQFHNDHRHWSNKQLRKKLRKNSTTAAAAPPGTHNPGGTAAGAAAEAGVAHAFPADTAAGAAEGGGDEQDNFVDLTLDSDTEVEDDAAMPMQEDLQQQGAGNGSHLNDQPAAATVPPLAAAVNATGGNAAAVGGGAGGCSWGAQLPAAALAAAAGRATSSPVMRPAQLTAAQAAALLGQLRPFCGVAPAYLGTSNISTLTPFVLGGYSAAPLPAASVAVPAATRAPATPAQAAAMLADQLMAAAAAAACNRQGSNLPSSSYQDRIVYAAGWTMPAAISSEPATAAAAAGAGAGAAAAAGFSDGGAAPFSAAAAHSQQQQHNSSAGFGAVPATTAVAAAAADCAAAWLSSGLLEGAGTHMSDAAAALPAAAAPQPEGAASPPPAAAAAAAPPPAEDVVPLSPMNVDATAHWIQNVAAGVTGTADTADTADAAGAAADVGMDEEAPEASLPDTVYASLLPTQLVGGGMEVEEGDEATGGVPQPNRVQATAGTEQQSAQPPHQQQQQQQKQSVQQGLDQQLRQLEQAWGTAAAEAANSWPAAPAPAAAVVAGAAVSSFPLSSPQPRLAPTVQQQQVWQALRSWVQQVAAAAAASGDDAAAGGSISGKQGILLAGRIVRTLSSCQDGIPRQQLHSICQFLVEAAGCVGAAADAVSVIQKLEGLGLLAVGRDGGLKLSPSGKAAAAGISSTSTSSGGRALKGCSSAAAAAAAAVQDVFKCSRLVLKLLGGQDQCVVDANITWAEHSLPVLQDVCSELAQLAGTGSFELSTIELALRVCKAVATASAGAGAAAAAGAAAVGGCGDCAATARSVAVLQLHLELAELAVQQLSCEPPGGGLERRLLHTLLLAQSMGTQLGSIDAAASAGVLSLALSVLEAAGVVRVRQGSSDVLTLGPLGDAVASADSGTAASSASVGAAGSSAAAQQGPTAAAAAAAAASAASAAAAAPGARLFECADILMDVLLAEGWDGVPSQQRNINLATLKDVCDVQALLAGREVFEVCTVESALQLCRAFM